MCNASNFKIGATPLQANQDKNKVNFVSADLRLFTQAELKLSTFMRECTVMIYTNTEYEFVIPNQ